MATVLILVLVYSVSVSMKVNGLQIEETIHDNVTCSDAYVYLKQDWVTYTSCCKSLYPNVTCPIVCPCRNGAECFPNSRTCSCKPGWVGSRCQTSCRGKNNHTYGQDCQRECRCGQDADCEPVTGICVCRNTSSCDLRCPTLRYGPKCRRKCRCETDACSHLTGVCDYPVDSQGSGLCGCQNGGTCISVGVPCRCQAGWTGRLCDAPCPVGFYGENCTISCGCGQNSTCSEMTGLCTCSGDQMFACAGRCPGGTVGPRCAEKYYCPRDLEYNPRTGNCGCDDGDSEGTCRELTSRLEDHTAGTDTIETPSITELPPPPDQAFTTADSLATGQNSPVYTPNASRPLLTANRAVIAESVPTTRRKVAAEDGGVGVEDTPAASLRPDRTLNTGGSDFFSSPAFWGVLSVIAVFLIVVVVLLLIVLKRQTPSARSPLSRRTKVAQLDNVYETVDEAVKSNEDSGDSTVWAQPPPPTPPPLPDIMHHKERSSGFNRVHRPHHFARPLSVHSPLSAMDSQLPASVAALVCNNYGCDAPPARSDTSRRSLMAEWRPYGNRLDTATVDRTASSDSRSSTLTSAGTCSPPPPMTPLRDHAATRDTIMIEDDYADPFDAVLPWRSSANLSHISEDSDRRQPQSPAADRATVPVTQQASSVPNTLEQGNRRSMHISSGTAPQQNSSPMSLRRISATVMRSDSPMSVTSRGNSPAPSSPSPSRREGANVDDPFYFTLRNSTGSSTDHGSPDDDYDELEPQSPIERDSPLIGGAFTISDRSGSERSVSTSSKASSLASVSTGSPKALRPSSPFNPVAVTDRHRTCPTAGASYTPQRALPVNLAYEICNIDRPLPTPFEDNSDYSRLNRSQRSDQPVTSADTDSNPYGRLRHSYSAKNIEPVGEGETAAGRDRHHPVLTKAQSVSAVECEASDWTPAVPSPRPLLPPRSAKSPIVTQPRKKFRWSLRVKKQLTKKPSIEEVESTSGPKSPTTLTNPETNY